MRRQPVCQVFVRSPVTRPSVLALLFAAPLLAAAAPPDPLPGVGHPGLLFPHVNPLAIAFADNTKAYVALSSENRVAVVDVARRSVVKSLPILAQDPRAI